MRQKFRSLNNIFAKSVQYTVSRETFRLAGKKGNKIMLGNYGLVYYDNEDGRTRFIPFLTKKEVKQYINAFDLGKDGVSILSIVKMVESWNAYDGIVYPTETKS